MSEYDEILLVRKDHGKSFVRPSNLSIDAARREKLIKEFDPERNELFFCRRLLVVEGDTEKLAFPEFAKRLGIDLDKAGATIVEVGGKRNLIEFARIAGSFGIPVGVVYDKDSSDFGKDKNDEEESYNSLLDSLAKGDGSVRVWRFDAKYEDHLRTAMGKKEYLEACERHPGLTKAARARLLAIESELVPEPLEEVLRWLGNRPAERIEASADSS
jgi:predicted ATP-dependent endonuclease of OLD family